MTKEQSIYSEDYPLQGSELDVALRLVLRFTRDERANYINRLLSAFKNLIDVDEFALKNRTPFSKEMRDLRRLLHLPADSYLFREDGSKRRCVLGKGAPGATHDFWSRTQMWKMVTSQGNLSAEIKTGKAGLVKRIDDFFNPEIDTKNVLRDPHKSAIRNLLKYLKMDKGIGSAFPPFHARFLCDYFLPKKQSNYLVIDPCAGWGGRLLGTLAVPRNGAVKYVGIDPEQRNSIAYEALVRRINIWLKKEIHGPREAEFFYSPFEDWICTSDAKRYFGKADLIITSPPYFGAELYNPDNLSQSFNRYPAYEDWVEGFYRPLVDGAFALLKPGGIFVLNIAKIKAKPRMKGGEQLETDARKLAREIGFENAGFFKLAMSKTPGIKEAIEQPKRGKSVHVLSVNGITWKYEPVFCFRKPTNTTSPLKKAIKKATHEKTRLSTPKVGRLSWDALRSLYKPYDKTCNDSFKRIKQKDKPSIIFLNGKPIAGAVINRRASAGYECLYKGKKRSVPCIKYEKGDTELSKFSVFDDSAEAKKLIIDHLRGVPRPCIVEVNSACKTEIELLKQSGFSLADASVNSMGDIYHLYIDSKNCNSRKQTIDGAERINVKQFTGTDFSSLAKRIEKKLAKEALSYRNHDSHYNIRDSWGALSLRGYTPDPLDIKSLEESAAHQREISDELRSKYHSSQLRLQDTSLMVKFPEVQQILNQIVPNSSKNGNVAFKRVRFMRLAPKEGELSRHTDLIDPTLGIQNGSTVRLHVPIKTNPKVEVTSWSLMNVPITKYFDQGELWYLNIRLPHKVINGGDDERIHLVIDAIADENIRALISGNMRPTKNSETGVTISRILEIFKKYKKDYFPHVWNTTLKSLYLKGNIWFDEDVAIVFNQYKRAQRLGCSTTEKGDWQIKQIAAMNQGDGSASRVLKKFLLKTNGVVWLTVRAANHRARKFYEKHDFKEVSDISWSDGKLPGVVYRREV